MGLWLGRGRAGCTHAQLESRPSESASPAGLGRPSCRRPAVRVPQPALAEPGSQGMHAGGKNSGSGGAAGARAASRSQHAFTSPLPPPSLGTFRGVPRRRISATITHHPVTSWSSGPRAPPRFGPPVTGGIHHSSVTIRGAFAPTLRRAYTFLKEFVSHFAQPLRFHTSNACEILCEPRQAAWTPKNKPIIHH